MGIFRLAEWLEPLWEGRFSQLDVRRHGTRQCPAEFGTDAIDDRVLVATWNQRGSANVRTFSNPSKAAAVTYHIVRLGLVNEVQAAVVQLSNLQAL